MAAPLDAFVQGDYKQAINRCLEILDRCFSMHIHVLLASLQRNGQAAAAERMLEHVRERLSNNPEEMAKLSLVHEPDAILHLFAQFADPEQQAEACCFAGIHLLTQGRDEEARSLFLRTAELNPGSAIHSLAASQFHTPSASFQDGRHAGRAEELVLTSVTRMNDGLVEEAEEAAKEAYEITCRHFAVDRFERVRASSNYAAILARTDRLQEAITILAEPLAVAEKPDLMPEGFRGQIYNISGNLLLETGRVDEAADAFRKSYGIRKRLAEREFGSFHSTASSLILSLLRLGYRGEARRIAEEFFAVADVLGERETGIRLWQWKGEIESAERSWQEAHRSFASAWQFTSAESDPQVKAVLLLQIAISDPAYDGAERSLKEAIEQARQSGLISSPHGLVSQVEAAYFLRSNGFLTLAERLLEPLVAGEPSSPAPTQERIWLLYAMATLYQERADHRGALAVCERAVEILREAEDEEGLILALDQVRSTAHRAGLQHRCREAILEVEERLAAIPPASISDNLVRVAIATCEYWWLANSRWRARRIEGILSLVLRERSDMDSELRRTVEDMVPVLNPPNPDAEDGAVTEPRTQGPRAELMTLRMLQEMAKTGDAAGTIRAIDAEFAKSPREEIAVRLHLIKAMVLIIAGELTSATHELDELTSHLKPQDVEAGFIIYDTAHARCIIALLNGSLKTAYDEALKIFDVSVRQALINTKSGADYERLRSIPLFRAGANALLTVLNHDPEGRFVAEAWQKYSQTEGTVFSSVALRNRIARTTGDPLLIRLLDELHKVMTEQRRLEMDGCPKGQENLEKYYGDRQSLVERRSQIEAVVEARVETLSEGAPSLWKDLLEDGEPCVIELVRFGALPLPPTPAKAFQMHDEGRYGAFVRRSGSGERLWIDLGPSSPIDDAVAAWRTSLTGEFEEASWRSHEEETECATEVKTLAEWLQPIVTELIHAPRAVIIPAGDLCKVPFAVLVYEACGGAECPPIQYAFSRHAEVPTASVAGSTPYVVFAPDYEAKPDGHVTRETEDKWVPAFRNLPFADAEAKRVSDLLAARLLTGGDANVAAVTDLASPQVLHISCHGHFFGILMGNNLALDLPFEIVISPEDIIGERATGAWIANPLLRCGIVLSGFNTWLKDGQTDSTLRHGFLTAYDVLQMDLQGTGLVFLAACDSTKGDIHMGEGMLGLPWAFHAAGAKAVVGGAWSVPDEPTSYLAEEFYLRVLAGERLDDAMTAAQRVVREKWPHPVAWGGLVVYGDPSPIFGSNC